MEKTLRSLLTGALVLLHAPALFSQEILDNTWVPNGSVNSIATYGDMVYVGGSFTKVTRADANGVVYNLETGQYAPSSNPNSKVSQVLPDYAGGFFINGNYITRVGDIARKRIAHIDAAGQVSEFNPLLLQGKTALHLVTSTTDRLFVSTATDLYCLDHNGSVIWSRQLDGWAFNGVVVNSTIYFVGRFGKVEGQPRKHIAAIDINGGDLLPFIANTAIEGLHASTPLVSPNLISIGSHGEELFVRYTLNGAFKSKLISISRTTGEPTGWSVPAPPTHDNSGAMMVHNGKVYLATPSGNGLQIFDCVTKQSLPIPSIKSTKIVGFAANGNDVLITSPSILDGQNNDLGDVLSFDSQTNAVSSYSMEAVEFVYAYSGYSIESIAVSGNRLYCAGFFSGLETVKRMNLYAYNKLTQEVSPLSFDFGTVDHSVNRIIATESQIFLEGNVFEINGQQRENGFASFDRVSGELSDWNPQIEFNQFAPSFYLHPAADGNIYIAGDITSVDNIVCDKIAVVNQQTFAVGPLNITPELLYIKSVVQTGNLLILNGRNLANTKDEIRFFDLSLGIEAFSPIEFVTASGGWVPMKVFNNTLYFAGRFTTLLKENVEYPRDQLAAVSLSNGSIIDFAVNIEPSNTYISDLEVTNGTMYIAGSFTSFNGIQRKNIAALDINTANATSWQPTLNSVYEIEIQADRILVGSDVPQLSTKTNTAFAEVTPDRSNKISGKVFYDNDGDGYQDPGELGIPDILIQLQPGNVFYPTDALGNYTAYTATGTYTLSPVLPNYTISTSAESHEVNFGDVNLEATDKNFGLFVQQNVTDVSVAVTTDQTPRPGFYFDYVITYKNEGTNASDGTINFDFDERLVEVTTSVAPTNADGNSFVFNYANLLPGETGSITINVRVPLPQVENMLGSIIEATAVIIPSASDLNSDDNTAMSRETVLGSFDPNDKLVTPQGVGEHGYIAENTEWLEYKIRFQNLGTFEATFVVITDELDQNLDASTFEFIEASPVMPDYKIENGILTVQFGDINNSIHLPHATEGLPGYDEPNSHGFFRFRIKLKENLPKHTRIENTASIVFDFNEPVITNTVANTLLDPPYSTTIMVAEVEGKKNAEVLVPVKVKDFTNLLGQQFSVAWDEDVATFVGVEQFGVPLGADNFNLTETENGYITYAWNSPSALTLDDETTLFVMKFLLTGNYGASTEIWVANHPTEIMAISDNDYEPVQVLNVKGKVTIDSEMDIAGAILYPNGEAVQNVTVTMTGADDLEDATDVEGKFSFTVQPQTEDDQYIITPSKTNDPDLMNGIDVQDVIFIRRHILKTEPFSTPYQSIAADVNNNAAVNIQDLIILQALILGNETDLPNGRQWAFVDKDHEFESLVSPFSFPLSVSTTAKDFDGTSIDFTAVKIGDVNLSRDNSQNGRTKTQEVVLETELKEEVEAGVTLVTISTFGFVDIAGYQFTINWNHEELEWIGAEDKSLVHVSGLQRTSEGTATFIWDDPKAASVTMEDGAQLLQLKFRKRAEDTTPAVTITGTTTPIRMYGKDAEAVKVTLRHKDPEDKFESGAFYPNPFQREATISFSTTESQDVAFQIMDVAGKIVHLNEFHAEKGYNEKTIDGDNLSPGAYVFKIQLREKLIQGKIIRRAD